MQQTALLLISVFHRALLQSGPYLGTLRPWAQEILFVFSYVQLSFQVQLISSTIPAIPLGK